MLPRSRIGSTFGWLVLAAGAVVFLVPGAGRQSIDLTSAQAAAPAPSGNTRPVMKVAIKADPAVSVKLASLVWLHKAGPATAESAAVPTTGDVAAAAPAAPATPAASPAPAAPAPVAEFVATSDVYVHTAPGNQSPRAFTLARGERVAEADTQSNWVEVKTDSGQSGWVYSRYLTAQASE